MKGYLTTLDVRIATGLLNVLIGGWQQPIEPQTLVVCRNHHPWEIRQGYGPDQRLEVEPNPQ